LNRSLLGGLVPELATGKGGALYSSR